MSRIKQKMYCIISMILLTCFMYFNYSQIAFALENAGVFENAFTWSIVDDVMTLQSTDGNWTAILKNDNCIVNGVELESKEVPNEVWDTDEIKPFLEWFNEHSMNSIELHVGSLYSSVGNDRYMRNITNLVVGEEVKFICDNAFIGVVQLNSVSIYSRDIDLTNSGIGYSSENEILENITIYGYIGSTAEVYANENGFTFISLDEQPTTTTVTEPIVTTTTASTTIVSTDETKTESTTDTTTISGTVTTDGITTVVMTETETDSKPTTTETDTEQTTATTTITIETDTEPTTMLTTTDTPGNITTESSTVTAVTTTETDTTLPQTGYSKWYQVIAGLAACMTGIGGAMVIGCGKLKKKKR